VLLASCQHSRQVQCGRANVTLQKRAVHIHGVRKTVAAGKKKLTSLIRSQNRIERLGALAEIYIGKLGPRALPSEGMTWDAFRHELDSLLPGFWKLTAPDGLGATAHAHAKQTAAAARAGHGGFIPQFFDADPTLALTAFAVARLIQPTTTVECGVGAGITSALLLEGMSQGNGRLHSVDMPPLSDPNGEMCGVAVDRSMAGRWTVDHGSTRRILPAILMHEERVDFLVSDSANVFTLQRFELGSCWRRMPAGAWALINNPTERTMHYARSLPGAKVWVVAQLDKAPCVTALLAKE
jgi:hypothetical protein